MRTFWLALSLACATLWGAADVRAQVFSPGVLSKGHKDMDGLTGCTKCHPEGGQHDNARCTECHKEIGRRIDAGKGFHTGNVKTQQCAQCHREHRGLNAKLIEYVPSMERFNHNLAGWPLEGPHKKQECKTCHEPRRMVDDEVKTIVKKHKRESMLGLGTTCVTCHHDEHRGQEGTDCTKCHTIDDYKKYPKFDHNDKAFAKWALVGKHKKVECKECHDTLTEPKKDQFPPAKDETYLQLKDISHGQCVECHDDFHNGAFGGNCNRCHTPEGWRVIKEGVQKDTKFHDKHAFKLRGQHMEVDCKSCHGPFPGQAAKFKGVKFKNCADCHADAHVGQIEKSKEHGVVRCEDCHDVKGFQPVNFDPVRHDKTRFPLENSHRTVACNLCHERDAKMAEKVARAVAQEFSRQRRAVVVSEARLKFPEIATGGGQQGEAKDGKRGQCEKCHDVDDPHGGQFIKLTKELEDAGLEMRGCADCHGTTTFADLALFSHDKTRFPLTGKHQPVECNSCHFEGDAKSKMKGIVMYRPLPFECGNCHADEHVGQLTRTKDARNACSDCHSTAGFAPAKFDHDTQSQYPLVGQHEKAECKACHPMVDVAGNQIARYKPVPINCIECHEDEHNGGFDGFNPQFASEAAGGAIEHPAGGGATDAGVLDGGLTDGGTVAVMLLQPLLLHGATPDAGPALPSAPATGADAGVVAAPATLTMAPIVDGEIGRCDGCHTPEGWGPALFAHERTGWPLTGKHVITNCFGCHQNNYERSTNTSCATCHRDPHAQEFGTNCQGCHTTDLFTGPQFPVDAHRRLNFPLIGRHAALPCDECHVEKRDRTFTRAALGCNSCHARDALAATGKTVNHQRAPFTADCRGCHTPIKFIPATFVQHDKCFPVSRGTHSVVACNTCHAGLAGARFTGDCTGVPVLCAQCHTHNEAAEAKHHENVPGYDHQSEKCATCHRAGR